MRKLLVLFFFLALGLRLSAQDLIVTQEGDSLNCKITKEAKDKLYFTFVYKEEIRNTLLFKNQVRQFQYNFYNASALPAGEQAITLPAYPKLRVGVSGGWSYRTARTAEGMDPLMENYIDELKSGYHVSADLAYYFSEQIGAGLRYSSAFSENKANNITVTYQDGSTATGSMSDDISIAFIGPYFSSRMLNANKLNALLFNVGLGYLGYQDKSVLVDTYTIKGSTMGFSLDIGYDMSISKKLSLGVMLSMLGGTLDEYEINHRGRVTTVKLENENRENLSRIDLSVGLRFNH
jgi:hypothetical protein